MKWMDWTAEGDVHKVTGDLDQEDEGLHKRHWCYAEVKICDRVLEN